MDQKRSLKFNVAFNKIKFITFIDFLNLLFVYEKVILMKTFLFRLLTIMDTYSMFQSHLTPQNGKAGNLPSEQSIDL